MRFVLASDEFIISEIRPRRSYIAFFQRWYGFIIALTVSAILALTVAPHASVVALVTIAGYWFYFFVKHTFRTREVLRKRFISKEAQLARALLLILGVTLLHCYLYLATDFLAARGLNHTLWLLLLLATLITSQRGSTVSVCIALGCAIASLAGTTFLAASRMAPYALTLPLAFELGERVLWLSLLSFTLHLFVRFVGSLYADVRLLNALSEELADEERVAILGVAERAGGTAGESGAVIQRVVKAIATNYDVPHVNLFERQPDQSLKCVAAASGAGQVLVDGEFRLEGEPSLVFKATNGRAVLCNDTSDQRGEGANYRAHPVFEHTRSELAVPVRGDGQTLGVLDLQADHPQAFLDQDKEVMAVLATQLARTLNNIRAHAWRRRFGTTIQSVAARLLEQSKLIGTLDEIVKSARELLEADIVVLYARNPSTGAVTRPAHSGQLLHPELLRAPLMQEDGLLARLIEEPTDAYYQSELREAANDRVHALRPVRNETDRQSFEDREKVRARAVLRLTTGRECVGIMFVNYRQPREFGEMLKSGARTFANLAALAIRQAQLDELELEFQRHEQAREVHDALGPLARETLQGIVSVLGHDVLNEQDRKLLVTCRETLERMLHHLRYLHETIEDRTHRPLSEEVSVIASRVRQIYGIDVDVEWTAEMDCLPAPIAWQVQLMVDELVLNALRHGGPSRISLRCCAVDAGLSFTVQDNGKGFDQHWIRPSGIEHVRERARQLGGNCEIVSAHNQGTCVTVRLFQPAAERVES